MKTVRVAELKSRLSQHLRAVEAGEVIEVAHRARPVARLVPIERDADTVEIIPAERPFSSVRRIRLPKLKLNPGSLEALRKERGRR
jgi:prevent-host-death family protein